VGLVLGAGPAAGEEMRVLLEHDTVHLDERVRMVLEIPTRWGSAGPDFSLLAPDFEVLASSMGRETEFEEEGIRALTRWLVELRPRRIGELTIPVLRVSVYQSRPRSITVLPPRPAAEVPDGPPELLMEVTLAPERPYERAQAMLRVRLYHAVDLARGVIDEPRFSGATLVHLGQDQRGETTRHGRRYGIIERRYALFPRSAGALEIPAIRFEGVADDGVAPSTEVGRLFGRGRRVRVSSAPRTITVRAPPPGASAPWLPAREVSLSESWSRDPETLVAGEAVTRTLVLSVTGLRGEQLPALGLPPLVGAVAYADRPQRSTLASSSGVQGRYEQRVALVAEREGTLVLPPVRVAWWDTAAGAPRETVLPGRALGVAAGGGVVAAGVPDTASRAAVGGGRALPWQVASGVLAAMWLVTLVGWYQRRPRPEGEVGRRDLRRACAEVRLACASSDPERARTALLAWGALAFPGEVPASLAALGGRLRHPELMAELLRLERALYGKGASPWSGRALKQAVDAALTRPSAAPRRAAVLPPLHPVRGIRHARR
jgi:hypothetical protein